MFTTVTHVPKSLLVLLSILFLCDFNSVTNKEASIFHILRPSYLPRLIYFIAI